MSTASGKESALELLLELPHRLESGLVVLDRRLPLDEGVEVDALLRDALGYPVVVLFSKGEMAQELGRMAAVMAGLQRGRFLLARLFGERGLDASLRPRFVLLATRFSDDSVALLDLLAGVEVHALEYRIVTASTGQQAMDLASFHRTAGAATIAARRDAAAPAASGRTSAAPGPGAPPSANPPAAHPASGAHAAHIAPGAPGAPGAQAAPGAAGAPAATGPGAAHAPTAPGTPGAPAAAPSPGGSPAPAASGGHATPRGVASAARGGKSSGSAPAPSAQPAESAAPAGPASGVASATVGSTPVSRLPPSQARIVELLAEEDAARPDLARGFFVRARDSIRSLSIHVSEHSGAGCVSYRVTDAALATLSLDAGGFRMQVGEPGSEGSETVLVTDETCFNACLNAVFTLYFGRLGPDRPTA